MLVVSILIFLGRRHEEHQQKASKDSTGRIGYQVADDMHHLLQRSRSFTVNKSDESLEQGKACRGRKLGWVSDIIFLASAMWEL